MSTLDLYLILKADAVAGFLAVTGFFGAGMAFLVFLFTFIMYRDKGVGVRAPVLSAVAFLLFSAILLAGALIPTTNQLAILYVAPRIVNNEQVQKIPQQILDIANGHLEKWRNEAEEFVE